MAKTYRSIDIKWLEDIKVDGMKFFKIIIQTKILIKLKEGQRMQEISKKVIALELNLKRK